MKKLNQQGAVAMISVVIFSIIISILVAAYARTIVSQQRQAINYDLSTRAYYAAESGVQDSIRALNNAEESSSLRQSGKSDCPPLESGQLDGATELEYTCQLIEVNSKTVPLPIEQNQTTAVSVRPVGIAGSNNTLTVTWAYDDTRLQPRPGSSKLFPPTSQWNSGNGPNDKNFPALLRLTFITFPKTGTLTANSFKQHVYFLNPVGVADADAGAPVINPAATQSEDSVVRNASCQGQQCTARFTLDAGFLNSNNLYAAAHGIYDEQPQASISVARENGEAYSFEGFASIDITGRAGNVFRRVKQTVAYSGGSSRTPSYTTTPFGPEALIAGEGICKLFTVGTSPSQYTNFCE